jgi:hypothetical protein
VAQRRPPQVAAEVLEPGAVEAGHVQTGVEVEALPVRLARPRGGDPRRVRLRSEAEETPSGTSEREKEVYDLVQQTRIAHRGYGRPRTPVARGLLDGAGAAGAVSLPVDVTASGSTEAAP